MGQNTYALMFGVEDGMTTPPAVTDESLSASVQIVSDEATALEREASPFYQAMGVHIRAVINAANAKDAWKSLALVLLTHRGRGNEADVLKAISQLDKLGEKVPAVVRLP